MLELASRDELTDLANRRRFNETIDLEVERANRYHRPITLVLFDLDSLKTVNDTHGHPTGDAAIRHIGACLRSEIRRFEVAARVGGDEFAVLLVDTNFDAGRIVAEKLRKENRRCANSTRRHRDRSAGVASLPAHAITSSDLVRIADEALYEAKNSGRNRVVVSRSLRQERDGERHPVRFKIVVAGKDSAGRDFTEETETELISRRGSSRRLEALPTRRRAPHAADAVSRPTAQRHRDVLLSRRRQQTALRLQAARSTAVGRIAGTHRRTISKKPGYVVTSPLAATSRSATKAPPALEYL